MGNLREPASGVHNAELIPILRDMNPRGTVAPFTIEERRKNALKGVARWGVSEQVASVTDETVTSPDGEIGIRVYRPKFTQTEPLPAVLYLHGGGFISGSVESHDPLCRAIANHVPALVVSVEYRLAPEFTYPVAAEDSFAAVTWLATNAKSLGVDADRIVIAGDSAGGNLAAVIALMARDRGGAAVAAQVLIYPMLDATFASESVIENAFIPPFTLVDCVYTWQLYLGANADRRSAYVSPLHAPNLAGLPPALVITAELDILADEGERYAERLREAGVAVEHEHFDEMVHGFLLWNGSVAAARLALNRVVQFIQKATTAHALVAEINP